MENKIKEKIFSIIRYRHNALSIEEIESKLDKNVSKSLVRRALDFLKSEGKIVVSKRGKFMTPENAGCIEAEIISHSKNFSFAKSLYGNEDIFISKSDIKKALLGDHVIIDKIRNGEKGLSGSVKKITHNGYHTIVGRVSQGIRALELICDSHVRYAVPIQEKYKLNAHVGDKVKAELIHVKGNDSIFAKVIEVFGKANIAKVCADAIINSRQIPTEFSKKLLDLANIVSKSRVTKDEISRRVDLRDEIIFTLDGEDSKDLDDAISIKKNENGWEIGVHIADVSHYIEFGSDLDKEAFLRGTSIYYADSVIPMLPQSISNGICSLNEGEDKLAFSTIIHLDDQGKIINYKFVESVINSKVRGVYSEVNQILRGKASREIIKKYEKVINSINLSKELSDILSKNSENRGVVNISSGESKFIIDENGICRDIKPKIQGDSETIIENLMIVANSAAAGLAKSLEIPFVYRIHEEPDPSKVEILANLSRILGLKVKGIKKGVKPADLSALLNQTEGLPSNKIISRQILQTMAKARYDFVPLGHFGLALKDYCHFTSPIRRYPDICVHRILKDVVRGMSIQNILNKYEECVQDYSRQSTMCEIRAMKAERDAEKYYMAEFMTNHIGEKFKGIISGAGSKGVFIELQSSVSGFLDLSQYPNSKFVFDGLVSHNDLLSGRKLTVGDEIEIRVISSNVSSAQIDFAPAEIFDD